MNERAVNLSSFVPFALGAKAADPAAAAAAFRPKIMVPSGEQDQEESRVPGDEKSLPASPVTPQSPKSPHTCAQPVITLQREGERVTSVRVECSCGQVIELACSY